MDCKTLEEIRLMTVERVREGELAAMVIEAYRFSRTTIYKWLTVVKRASFLAAGITQLSGAGSVSFAVERLDWVSEANPIHIKRKL